MSYAVLFASATYELLRSVDGVDAIRCKICGQVSHNPNDVRERYCGACCAFHTISIREALNSGLLARGKGGV